MADNLSKTVILKFGGTSVATRERWETIAQIASDRLKENLRPVIVCSAAAGVSDMLEELLKCSVKGDYNDKLSSLQKLHNDLASNLSVSFDVISEHMDSLGHLLEGISKVGEATPRVRAKVMAHGELMLTKLGAEFLNAKSIDTKWQDVRNWLTAENIPLSSDYRRFGNASCGHDPDKNLQGNNDAGVIITQGFIANDSEGETVLLGRGGSDVSASYLAAKLGAVRCEIWTDVPGMYTANPHKVQSARIIKALDYDEAQEIASLGAKVLHPRCLAPAKRYGIPIYVKCMQKPDIEGTIVSSSAKNTSGIKAISMKHGINLISMESVEMWHQVGFLADAFNCFKDHGVSIDLVSTSETNVTVSIDQVTGGHDPEVVKDLLRDLQKFCRPKLIDSCALISLIGRNIRGTLHKLSPAFDVFEEKKVYLLSQAANDLNLTFVVDEDEADRLVRKIHTELIPRDEKHSQLGDSWNETFGESEKSDETRKWWMDRSNELLKIASEETPLYAYDSNTIKERVKDLKDVKGVDRIFYSLKANPHPDILNIINDAGLGFECVSFAEVLHTRKCFPKVDPGRILFTPNFVPRKEYEGAMEIGCHVTLDNLYPLKIWPDIFKGKDILVRVDPGEGFGHHKFVRTAGSKSKFGVSFDELNELHDIATKNKTRIVGLHAHVGSNILAPDTWANTAKFLSKVALDFADVKYLDLGGGFGIVEKPGTKPLDTHQVGDRLSELKKELSDIEIWIEPGRFVIAEAGVLLAKVTQTKTKGNYSYIGIDAGMNTLIRPSLYGSFHEIVNLSRLGDDPDTEANIVGPICESGDVLGYDRQIATPTDGDIILIATAGAYGSVMSSEYNMRKKATEMII
ncbi:MAG: bifunctional aspartate kinase/diaminopimelate decarboxylase [Deltaproteobacteria bacterium]|jgi:bifunctional diaminopimelate decarboxylase / aspartate kinase|nr:bifunctional aspartate kinase/diaminopimelate decarboxylase [Deltaproteobacteria bacterium]